MLKKHPFLFLLVLLLSVSCDDKQKQEQLTERETKLLEKEKLFAKKESEYQALLKMRDSIFNKKDSVQILLWPQEVAGVWSGKVICTESNCSDYAVGDQRIDNWEFDSDSIQLSTKIINNNNLIRTYLGKFENNEVKLNYKTDSTAQKNVEMNILLNEISPNKIRGIRTVTVDNNCTARFSVELTRIQK
ncbi:MAG: hypothetical protein K0R77_2559 [Chryseobacterium sp.]|jgi:hypothetical protein|uniref:hypothetical protein n=1 Tax=Chryseobacterium sp. TaxID=1871047 RepID=UPI00260F90AA|nr:hypothetical protein [Chryseobacterium sp.]MDF2553284.1 hypothetical protein [Chryseobacterium sp.]